MRRGAGSKVCFQICFALALDDGWGLNAVRQRSGGALRARAAKNKQQKKGSVGVGALKAYNKDKTN